MRLIAWNANYNGRKRSLEEDVALLKPLAADILVLSETAPPKCANDQVLWTGGGAPGLAVVVNQGFTAVAHPLNDGAPQIMSAVSVKGRSQLELLAVWPVETSGQKYHQVLMAGLDHYADFLQRGRAFMVGDFNSSTRVRKQSQSHPEFVKAADTLGLVSIYHFQTGEAHGQELLGTYRHLYRADQQYHIDYCFVPRALAPKARVTILSDDVWMNLSDHFPLILDIEDADLVTSTLQIPL